MPVTIIPSPDKVGTLKYRSVVTSHALLEASSKAWTTNGVPRGGLCTNKKNGKEDRDVLKSSFEDHLDHSAVVSYGNGFVTGIIRAFNQDLHLILRPDDVWLAILTQFSMYINGHAEEMRPFLVSHEGKKKVVIDVRPSSLADVDMGKMAFTLTKEVQKHIVDPELQE
ncbi:hypothetical protein AK830_g224 [Neonectria ditissima]|uniref:Uncharacterized protein n=1 Tax=Neonectria ditissima TaxID=78410 RepID=A0A0N8H959_9HYPO|nr:hypothetical protein AK830_g224 [Neonectria ditissima]